MITNKQIIDNWASDVIGDLIKNYDLLGLRASGKFAKGLTFKSTSNRLIVYSEPHAIFMENGRGPSSGGKSSGRSLKEIIRDWIDDRGITPKDISKDSLAFLIARKIHRQGIQVPNKYNRGKVITSVLNDQRIDQLIDQIKDNEVDFLRTDLTKIFKAA